MSGIVKRLRTIGSKLNKRCGRFYLTFKLKKRLDVGSTTLILAEGAQQMKSILLLISMLACVSCVQASKAEQKPLINIQWVHDKLPRDGFYKFTDGDVVCYFFTDVSGRSGMSCLKK